MSRTTTREIIQVCTAIAKLDKKGKEEVWQYLVTELQKIGLMEDEKRRGNGLYPTGDEQ